MIEKKKITGIPGIIEDQIFYTIGEVFDDIVYLLLIYANEKGVKECAVLDQIMMSKKKMTNGISRGRCNQKTARRSPPAALCTVCR